MIEQPLLGCFFFHKRLAAETFTRQGNESFFLEVGYFAMGVVLANAECNAALPCIRTRAFWRLSPIISTGGTNFPMVTHPLETAHVPHHIHTVPSLCSPSPRNCKIVFDPSHKVRMLQLLFLEQA